MKNLTLLASFFAIAVLPRSVAAQERTIYDINLDMLTLSEIALNSHQPCAEMSMADILLIKKQAASLLREMLCLIRNQGFINLSAKQAAQLLDRTKNLSVKILSFSDCIPVYLFGILVIVWNQLTQGCDHPLNPPCPVFVNAFTNVLDIFVVYVFITLVVLGTVFSALSTCNVL